jgi:hypothetical protein
MEHRCFYEPVEFFSQAYGLIVTYGFYPLLWNVVEDLRHFSPLLVVINFALGEIFNM